MYASIATGIAIARFDHVGATPQCTFSTSVSGLKTSAKPTIDEQELRREVDDGERDRELRRLLDADDVQRHEDDDHDAPHDDVPGVRVQRLPEDREVVRDEERRDGDGDDVDEHLRPARDEADELVERVPREARGAARLGVARGALGVGRGGRREDDAGDDEDERRQAERVERREPERVVDRGADVAVGGREERGRAEGALELDLPPAVAAAGHGAESTSETRRGRRIAGPLVDAADASRRYGVLTAGSSGSATPSSRRCSATEPRYRVRRRQAGERRGRPSPCRRPSSAAGVTVSVMLPALAVPTVPRRTA